MSEQLATEVKATLIQAALADGQTDPASTAIDMAGFDGVLLVGIVGAVTATGTVTLAAEQSADNGAADPFTPVAGASAAADDQDGNKLLMLDLYRPRERFIRTQLTRGTANSVYGGTLALQYAGRSRPTEHDAATLAAVALVIPTA
ncbi:MAG: hypothetical protein GC191_09470 [Azospirillum sp.]|nr:hypothetical protein [Azospirillum sp.]